MIRVTTFALAAAMAGSLLLSGVAEAASPLTLKCVRREAGALKTCINDCRTAFKSARADCYGPGRECANQCTAANDACQGPITEDFSNCNLGCTGAQRDTIDACRSAFQEGLITEAQLETCANNARLTTLQCKLDCTASVDNRRLDCNQIQAACLGACASCGLPSQCP